MREVAGSNLPAPSRHLYIGCEKHRAESVSLFQPLLPRGSADLGGETGEGPVVVEAALSSRRRTASAGRYRRYERQRYGHLWIEPARYASRDDVDGPGPRGGRTRERPGVQVKSQNGRVCFREMA